MCLRKTWSINEKSRNLTTLNITGGACHRATKEGFNFWIDAGAKLKTGPTDFNQQFNDLHNWPRRTAGVLGQNFLKTFGGVINFEEGILILKQNRRNTVVTLSSTDCSNDAFCVPPRSEVVKFLKNAEECVVVTNNLCEGVFVASARTKPVKIINTREQQVWTRNM